jgi:hypothetical protein
MLFDKNIIEKSFMNWRVLSSVKINTHISDTPCIVRTFVLLYVKNTKFSINTLKLLVINGKYDSILFGTTMQQSGKNQVLFRTRNLGQHFLDISEKKM